MGKTLTPRKGLKWKAEATAAIFALQRSDAYKRPLESPSCDKADPAGLVTRTFHFTGKGRDIVMQVTAHAKAMVGLLKAMRACPSIQVTQSSTSKYSGSYRSWDQQYTLWWEYTHGQGHRAAHPCSGYHRQGRAFDLYVVQPDERKAMMEVRVDGIRFYDGLAFGDPPHFTLGAEG